MKLLEALSLLDEKNIDLLKEVKITVELRLDWLVQREPSSNGTTYDTWSEKMEYMQSAFDSFSEALDYCEELLTCEEKKQEQLKDSILDLIHDGVTAINDYQDEYGGLSKLDV